MTRTVGGYRTRAASTTDASRSTRTSQLPPALPIKGLASTPGLLYDQTPTVVATDMGYAATDGAKYFRIQLQWSAIETSNGVYDWSIPDMLVSTALAAGLTPFMQIGSWPGWTNGSQADIFYSSTPAYLQAFAEAAALRYIPDGVTIWEVFNEPGSGFSWATPNAANYTTYALIPAWNGLQAAASSLGETITVLIGGLDPASNGDTSNGYSAISPVTFVTNVYAAGGKDYFDGIGVHPYTRPNSAAYLEGDPNHGDPLILGNIYAVMCANGDNAKKLWMTECGWGVSPTVVGPVTAAQQATYTQQLWEILSYYPFMAGTMFCTFMNIDDDNATLYYGLRESDGTERAVRGVFAGLS